MIKGIAAGSSAGGRLKDMWRPSSEAQLCLEFLDVYGEEHSSAYLFLKDFIYLFLKRGEESKRNINGCFSHPQLGTRHAAQACALTGNWTSDALLCRPAPKPLNHNSQGQFCLFVTFHLEETHKNRKTKLLKILNVNALKIETQRLESDSCM